MVWAWDQKKREMYSQPSVSKGSTNSVSLDSTNCGWKTFGGKKKFVVADLYCVVRLMMVVSALNRCRHFF